FYGLSQDQFQKLYSDDTATLIDDRVREIIEEQYARAQRMLREHREHLESLAKVLLEKEVLHKADIEKLIGKRPFATKDTHYHPEVTNDLPPSAKEEQAPDVPPPIPSLRAASDE